MTNFQCSITNVQRAFRRANRLWVKGSQGRKFAAVYATFVILTGSVRSTREKSGRKVPIERTDPVRMTKVAYTVACSVTHGPLPGLTHQKFDHF